MSSWSGGAHVSCWSLAEAPPRVTKCPLSPLPRGRGGLREKDGHTSSTQRPPPCPAGHGGGLCLVTSHVTSTGALGPSRLCPCVPDVDECAADTPPCGDQQYCENVNGSFVCQGAWARAPAGGQRSGFCLPWKAEGGPYVVDPCCRKTANSEKLKITFETPIPWSQSSVNSSTTLCPVPRAVAASAVPGVAAGMPTTVRVGPALPVPWLSKSVLPALKSQQFSRSCEP